VVAENVNIQLLLCIEQAERLLKKCTTTAGPTAEMERARVGVRSVLECRGITSTANVENYTASGMIYCNMCTELLEA